MFQLSQGKWNILFVQRPARTVHTPKQRRMVSKRPSVLNLFLGCRTPHSPQDPLFFLILAFFDTGDKGWGVINFFVCFFLFPVPDTCLPDNYFSRRCCCCCSALTIPDWPTWAAAASEPPSLHHRSGFYARFESLTNRRRARKRGRFVVACTAAPPPVVARYNMKSS